MIKKVFIRGLVSLAPIAITLAILIWLYDIIEGFFSKIIIDLLGPQYYFKGLGVILMLVIIFIFGFIINNFIIQKIYSWFEKLLHKMPLVKTLYRSITDLMSFFKGNSAKSHGAVVVIDFQGARVLGLVSRESFKDLPEGIGSDEEIAVFVPMSYQIGGVTLLVPKSKVKKIEMSVEQGLRFAATAGMPGEQEP
jgi:uncharacterized membrane protein